MTSNLQITVLFCLATLMFSGCKKYEENEGLTLKSSKNRIIGTWEIVRVGTEEYPLVESQTDYFEDYCGNTWTYKVESYLGYRYTFGKNNSGTVEFTNYYTYLDYSSYDMCTVIMEEEDYSVDENFSWDFALLKNYLVINNATLEITKLTDDELNLLDTWGERIELVKVN